MRRCAPISSQSYDRDASDVLKLQSEVARTIADKIRLTLSAQTTARLIRTPSLNPQAHEAFLEGLEAANLRTGKGWSRQSSSLAGPLPWSPIMPMPTRSSRHAPTAWPTVVGLGPPADMMRQARDAAEREFHRGIELNPSDANAHLFYSNSLLSPLGRHEQAIAEMNIAVRLDPLSAPVDSFVGRTYLAAAIRRGASAHAGGRSPPPELSAQSRAARPSVSVSASV